MLFVRNGSLPKQIEGFETREGREEVKVPNQRRWIQRLGEE